MPNKPWDRKGRAAREVRLRRKTLIFCEDTKSSAYYLASFPVDETRFELQVYGKGMNTDSLVEEALRFLRSEDRKRQLYSFVWCVMDRDSFPEENFLRAFDIARSNNVKIAWSNEAFELWYLLHFNYIDSALSRNSFSLKLSACGFEYDKADKRVFEKLKDRQEVAIKNALRLRAHWNSLGEKFPERLNPSTNIDLLVGDLRDLAELPQVEPTDV